MDTQFSHSVDAVPSTTEVKAPSIAPTGNELHVQVPAGAQSVPQSPMNDVWAHYYPHQMQSNCVGASYVISHAQTFELQTIKHVGKPERPPILIDSGASWSVAGESWVKSLGLDTLTNETHRARVPIW